MAPGLDFPSVRDPMLLLERLSSMLPRNSFWAPSAEPETLPAVFLGLSITFILGICSVSLRGPSSSVLRGCLSTWLRPVSKEVLWSGKEGLGMDIPDILSASAWAEAAEETRTGEWCLTGWGIRDGLLRLELVIPLQLLGPLLLLLLLPPPQPPPAPLPLLPPPPLLWFLWYSMGDVKAAIKTKKTDKGKWRWMHSMAKLRVYQEGNIPFHTISPEVTATCFTDINTVWHLYEGRPTMLHAHYQGYVISPLVTGCSQWPTWKYQYSCFLVLCSSH